MAQGGCSLTDREYSSMWQSLQGLQGAEAHVCTRQCEFKQVFGNLFYCTTSGQAHVCDHNCSQRIFYDNHHDICRLSRRIFPRDPAGGEGDAARKRTCEEEAAAAAAKRPQSADWHAQQQALAEQHAAAMAAAQQQQQQAVAAGVGWQQAPTQGWAC